MHTLLLVGSFCCFALAAWINADPWRGRLVSIGLAALVASMVPL